MRLTTTYKHPQSIATGGKRVDLDGQYFRSQSEANLARLFRHYGIPWEYEPKTFDFPVKRGTRSYTPDFRVDLTLWKDPEKSKQAWPIVLENLEPEKYWVEVKGWMDPKSQTRLSRFIKYYPEEAKRLILYINDPIKASRKWNPRLRAAMKGVIQVFDLRAVFELGPIFSVEGWEGGRW